MLSFSRLSSLELSECLEGNLDDFDRGSGGVAALSPSLPLLCFSRLLSPSRDLDSGGFWLETRFGEFVSVLAFEFVSRWHSK